MDRLTDIATNRATIAAKNMTTECSDIINYNNSNNIYTLTTAQHFHKTRCGPTDQQTDRQTDVATYRAAIAAKKVALKCCQSMHAQIVCPV